MPCVLCMCYALTETALKVCVYVTRCLFKQWLSHWIVENVSLAYSSRGLSLPQGVRAPSTGGFIMGFV